MKAAEARKLAVSRARAKTKEPTCGLRAIRRCIKATSERGQRKVIYYVDPKTQARIRKALEREGYEVLANDLCVGGHLVMTMLFIGW